MNTRTTRRYDIDWLRIIATLFLFVFHTGMIFSPAPFFHIRNGELSFVWLVVCGFISLWHMPLFFLLAGWSLWQSLSVRGARGVARERALRLFVPLVFGCLLFMPVIKYLELSSGLDLNHRGLRVAPALQEGFRAVIPEGLPEAAPFRETFAEFLPSFFTLERFTWAHLWFVAYLFTFTLLYLPILSYLRRRPSGFRRPRPMLVYAPVLLVALIQVVLRPHWPGIQNLYDDWANFAYYTTYFFAGFLLARDPALEQAAQREWRRALAIGFGACAILLGGVLRLFDSTTVLLAGSALAGWCFVVAALGLAKRFLDFGNAALHYLSEAAFPIYILHQAAIIVPGYFILRSPFGIGAKFSLIVAVAVLLSFGIYHFIVRELPPMRFLFGMRPKDRAAPTVAGAPSKAALLVIGVVLTGAPGEAASPEGRWYAEGGAAQVEIASCGETLCGTIVWLRSPLDENGCELTDRENPDEVLRSRSIVGLEILRDLRADEAAAERWDGGSIYDPTSGRTYRCRVDLDGPDRLRVRGYIGITLLGRTTTWTRVGSERRLCSAYGDAG
jgi:uncharacterized protein (DUF2147 family)/peptidoglycan/LPS O-acetylase OafA/YrhL